MRARQRGFSAALVLMVLVLLGGMLAYAVTLTSGLHSGIAQEIAQARALQAANAGLEWQRHRIRIGAAPCAAVANLTMPFSSGPFPVTVRCTPAGTQIGPPAVSTFVISATACLPAGPGGVCPNLAGSADYVERQAAGNTER